MKNLTAVSIIMVFAAILSLSFTAPAPMNKVTVCHIPPGNPGNCHEIEVSMNALDAHLAHGDNLVCHDEEEYPEYVQIATQRPMYNVTIITDFAKY